MLRMAFVVSIGLHLMLFLGISLFASPSGKQNDFRTEQQRLRQSANTARIRQMMTTTILPSQKATVCAVIYLQTPSNQPSPTPTPLLTRTPTPVPTTTPTIMPTAIPTLIPTTTPTIIPTPTPTLSPTVTPTITPKPTVTPTRIPTPTAMPKPTPMPTAVPTVMPKPVFTVRPALTPHQSTHPAVMSARPTNVQSSSERLLAPAEAQRGDADSSMTSQTLGNAEIAADGTINASGNHRETVQEDGFARTRYLEEIAKKIADVKSYPAQARRNGWEDTLIIELEIAASGNVLRAKVARASRFQVLNTAALDAVKRAQPFPAFDQQISAVPLIVKIPFEYTLKMAK